MWIIILQSTKIKTRLGNRCTRWDRQAVLPWPEQHKIHLLFFFKHPTCTSWPKVHTGPSPRAAPSVTALSHPTLHVCCSCPLWISVLALLQNCGQQEQIHPRNTGALCGAAWQSSPVGGAPILEPSFTTITLASRSRLACAPAFPYQM